MPVVANGKVVCNEDDKDEGTDNFLGGSLCTLTCDLGYLSTGTVQCINQGEEGVWTTPTCGKNIFAAKKRVKKSVLVKDERCIKEELPQVSDGSIKCKKSSNRLQARSKYHYDLAFHNSSDYTVSYVEAGTVCQIECDSAYEISGQNISSISQITVHDFDTFYFPRIISSYLQGNKLGKRWDLL